DAVAEDGEVARGVAVEEGGEVVGAVVLGDGAVDGAGARVEERGGVAAGVARAEDRLPGIPLLAGGVVGAEDLLHEVLLEDAHPLAAAVAVAAQGPAVGAVVHGGVVVDVGELEAAEVDGVRAGGPGGAEGLRVGQSEPGDGPS